MMEGVDRIFVKCLEEIMRAYSKLDKQSRIRVEQWAEKLSTVPFNDALQNPSGNFNITWKKHRNAYAKLLLNMVAARQLSPPFSNLPPPGPLRPFPSYLNQVGGNGSVGKNLLGPHELSFWRELFDGFHQNLQSSTMENRSIMQRSFSTRNVIDLSKDDSVFKSSSVTDKNSLKLLLDEQSIRIRLLEKQLREERLQHELTTQKLHVQHREEMRSVIEMLPQVTKTGASSTADWESSIRFINRSINRSAHRSNDVDERAPSASRRYRYGSSESDFQLNDLLGNKSSNVPSVENAPESASNIIDTSSKHRMDITPNASIQSSIAADIFPHSPNYRRNDLAERTRGAEELKQSETATYRTSSNSIEEDSLASSHSSTSHNNSNSELFNHTLSGLGIGKNEKGKTERYGLTTEMLGGYLSDEGDEFLRYIENFQKDIEALNLQTT